MASSCRRIAGLFPILFKDLSKPHVLNSTLNSSKCSIWNTQIQKRHFSLSNWKGKETVNLHFTFRDGTKQTVEATVGDSLLDTVVDKNVDIDGFGACEGTLACSTCHLIFTQEQYDSLSEPPTDEELDMLDLAFQLEDTSRLGCQISVTKDMEGWEILVPEGVADAREV